MYILCIYVYEKPVLNFKLCAFKILMIFLRTCYSAKYRYPDKAIN